MIFPCSGGTVHATKMARLLQYMHHALIGETGHRMAR